MSKLRVETTKSIKRLGSNEEKGLQRISQTTSKGLSIRLGYIRQTSGGTFACFIYLSIFYYPSSIYLRKKLCNIWCSIVDSGGVVKKTFANLQQKKRLSAENVIKKI